MLIDFRKNQSSSLKQTFGLTAVTDNVVVQYNIKMYASRHIQLTMALCDRNMS
jgi:hypothetical protein